MEKLQIGEKVLMFNLINDEKEKLDLINTFVTNIPKEVIVKKKDSVLSHDIFTVINENNDEYCGVHLYNDQFGKIGLLRREEYVKALVYIETDIELNGYFRGGFWTSKEKETLRDIKHQLNSICDHLFVKQTEGYWIGGFHSSNYEYEHSIVTCVHCGLSNRYKNFSHYKLPLGFELDNEAFSEYINTHCPSGCRYWKGDEDFIPLLSKKVYFFDRPEKLYCEAKKLNPDATNEEIFELMKKIDIENLNNVKVNVKK